MITQFLYKGFYYTWYELKLVVRANEIMFNNARIERDKLSRMVTALRSY